MPIKHAIWTVGEKPTALPVTRLATEQSLEDMIENDPRILSEQWMMIGRQEHTPTAGRIGKSKGSTSRHKHSLSRNLKI